MAYFQHKAVFFSILLSLSSFILFSQQNQQAGQPTGKQTQKSASKKQLSGLKLPPPTGDEGEAKNSFTSGYYRGALSEYLEFIKKEPSNPLYLYRIGICYLNGNIDFGKAAEFFQKALTHGSTEKDVYFQLARAQHLTYKFDDAIKNYTRGEEISKNKDLETRANRNIEMCKNAKALMKNPVNVTIDNLGADINSPEPDYYPFVDENETFLMFSTRRTKANVGYETSDGFFTSDIFISYEKEGKWQKSKPIGPVINTPNDEEVAGLANNGEIIFINFDSYELSGDILFSEKKGKQYQPPAPMPVPINTEESMDITAYMPPDKTAIYFASDRPGGLGGMDLYVSKKLPTGEWSPAFNLGQNINTEYNEYFPMLLKDGKTLYFSSEGHNSMGGFDIFKSEWSVQDTVWGKAVNIGYPVNTPDDDMEICFNGAGNVGYISSFRKGSLGDLDIYSVTFHDEEAQSSVIKGKILKMISIDYSENMTVHFYTKNGITKKFPESYLPKDSSWVFKEKKTEVLKPGFKFSVFVTLEKDGVAKKFSLAQVPKEDGYVFKDIAVSQVAIPNYKPPAKNRPTQTPVVVTDASITISVKSTGAFHGEYRPNANTGKYIIILPPGDYTLQVNADGFKEYTENVSIIGKGSFEAEIEKNITLTPLKAQAPIPNAKLK